MIGSRSFTVVPAIDLMDGKCVRLRQGVFANFQVYHLSPVEVARRFADLGFKRLHLVDLDGAAGRGRKNRETVRQICQIQGLSVDVGGGIRSVKDIRNCLEMGAKMVTVGTLAVKQRETLMNFIKETGGDRLMLAVDIKGNRLAFRGWRETSKEDVYQFVRSFQQAGISRILCTDVRRDGMLCGPATRRYRLLLERCPGIVLTAAGGIGLTSEIRKLQQAGVREVVVGRALYQGAIDIHRLAGEFLG